MYDNIAKAGRKDKKTRYYYYCKNTVNATGHKCTFRCNIEQSQIDDVLAKLITAMTKEGKFKDAIQDRIGATVDTSDLEKQLSVLNANLHRIKSSLMSILLPWKSFRHLRRYVYCPNSTKRSIM